MSNFNGSFVWFELMTSDPDAAESFYKHVVGWSATDAGFPDWRYTILKADGAPVGGLMKMPAKAPPDAKPGWIGYVGVDDVDSYAARIREAGGSLCHGPADIPGVGRFAVVADPEGAVFALFKGASEEAPPPSAPRAPGRLGWRELNAADQEKAFSFYAGLFGWTKAEAMDMGPMGVYQIFAIGGTPVGGFAPKREAPKSFWRYYFNVDNIEAAAARVKEKGGEILHGPQQVPGGSWIIIGHDPQGAPFALVAPPTA